MIIIYPMKYKLVIFDMDGTILNTIDDLADSCNVILERYGFPLHTTEEIKYMVGNGIPKLIQRALPDNVDKETYDKVLKDYIEYYDQHCQIKTAPYPGMTETLKELKKMGIKLAVNTNKVQSAAQILCDSYFPGLFDFLAGGAFDIPPKPAPDGVLKILQAEGLCPKDAIYIGDSDVDIQTGKNAGMDAAGVDWGFRGQAFLEEHGARLILKRCADILSIVK